MEQAVVALEHHWSNGVEFRAEAYRKSYSDLMPYFDQLFDDQEVLPELRSDRIRIDPEKARSQGVELDLRHFSDESFRWWATYTWSRAEERVGGQWIPRDWDQPHAFNTGLSFAVSDWTLTLALRYHSGWPKTPLRRIRDGSDTLAEIGARNSDRHGIYHRLDARASRRLQLPNSTLQFYLEIINLYNLTYLIT